MTDYILQRFVEPERWTEALRKGVDKGMCMADLQMLTRTDVRTQMLRLIYYDAYNITIPHTAYIPKDDGGERVVVVNEAPDRIFLSIVNDLLMELCSDMIHPACKSYQKGIGCGRIVTGISQRIVSETERAKKALATSGVPTVGWKADFTKYFDRVPRHYIDAAFDAVEERYGKSKIINVLRRYYHNDLYFDTRGDGEGEVVWESTKGGKHVVIRNHYRSLKQGCAVASWLANVIMYDLDVKLSALDGLYARYSDDTIFIGIDHRLAMKVMEQHMIEMSTPTLNMEIKEKKREWITADKWVTFLGYSIKGSDITLSKKWIKHFKEEIDSRTIDANHLTIDQSVRKVMDYLYKGDGKHSWATWVLAVVNVESDIDELNNYTMDALRAKMTGKTDIGGLGYVRNAQRGKGCISRGVGKNVRSNRLKTPKEIPGYRTMRCMRNAMRYNKSLYYSLLSAA